MSMQLRAPFLTVVNTLVRSLEVLAADGTSPRQPVPRLKYGGLNVSPRVPSRGSGSSSAAHNSLRLESIESVNSDLLAFSIPSTPLGLSDMR